MIQKGLFQKSEGFTKPGDFGKKIILSSDEKSGIMV
jgi:hypothetical protein